MEIYINQKAEEELNNFAKEQWDKTIALLRKYSPLSLEDCKDVFQEAFIDMLSNIKSGKFREDSNLSTYFNRICLNKAKRLHCMNLKQAEVDNDESLNYFAEPISYSKVDALLTAFDGEETIQEQKKSVVKGIVTNMPEPCNQILWMSYSDDFSQKEIAERLHYTTASLKVTKSRCSKKFRTRYAEEIKKII